MIMLYVARTLDGITGGNITTAQAYVTDVVEREHRAQALGLLQAAFGVGFIFGPAFGGILSNFGPVAPFVGATIITTGTLLLTTFTLEESLPQEERGVDGADTQHASSLPLRAVARESALVMVLGVGFFTSLAFSALPAIFSLYADHVLFADLPAERSQLYIGLMLTFNGLMQVITQLALLKPLVTRLGERRLLTVGQISLMLALLSVAYADSALVVTLLFAPFAFGQGVSQPSLQSLVTRFGTDRTRGQLLGLNQSARSLALIFGPIWAGYAYEAISPRAVFLVGSAIVLVGVLLALLLLRQEMPVTRERSIAEQTGGD